MSLSPPVIDDIEEGLQSHSFSSNNAGTDHHQAYYCMNRTDSARSSARLTSGLYGRNSQEAVPHLASHVMDQNNKENSAVLIKRLLGTFPVFMTSCETMWGVIIFIKFDQLLGYAGLYDIFLALALSMTCQLLAASSLSAIATNGQFKSGGSYYMVVRSLGPAIGAAIGLLYFFGMSLLASVEVLGATEALSVAFHLSSSDSNHLWSEYWDQVFFGCIMIMMLVGIRAKDGHWVHHIGVFVMIVFVFVVTSCIGGLFQKMITGWEGKYSNGSYWSSNLSSNYPEGKSFGDTVLALMYPTFIGIFQGANKVAELKKPYKSIPRGAFLSIITSGIFYTVLFTLLAVAVPRELLLDEDSHVLILLAWPTKWISVVGTVILGLGSALSCIDVAPSILQSLAADGYVPMLRPLSALSASGEPRVATAVTLLLCLPAVFVKDIETVATYTSLAFLTMYASMNVSCFIQSILSLHSWRPRFTFYHWSSAAAGLVLCLSIMFLMEPVSAGIILVVFIALIIYVQVNGEKVTWGHGAQGLKYRMALGSLMALEKEEWVEEEELPELKIDVKTDWRPQLLCYVKLDCETGEAHSTYLLDFIQQLKSSSGLNMVASVVVSSSSPSPNTTTTEKPRKFIEMAENLRQARETLATVLASKSVRAFTEVIAAPSAEIGEGTMIQTLGLGKLRPNTLVVAWPKPRESLSETEARASRFLRFLECATAFDKAVVALKPGRESFPPSCVTLSGTIDIWWVVHDGGLLLLLSHLLQKSDTWANCKLRIFTAVDISESPVLIKRALAQYLQDLRITAEIHVVDISKQDVSEFCNEWTVRRERYCSIKSTAAGPARVLLDRVASMSSINYADKPKLTEIFTELLGTSTTSTSSAVPGHEQFRAAKQLKASILEHSSSAQLVVMNLPVPSKHNWEVATSYLDVVDDLTLNLSRVLLVHGSGTEALSKFA